MAQSAHTGGVTLARGIGLTDGIALVVGGIIGSGIFRVPSEVSSHLESFGAVILE